MNKIADLPANTPKREDVRNLIYSVFYDDIKKITVGQIENIINAIIDIVVKEARQEREQP